MLDKTVASLSAAVEGINDGATILLGGFMNMGFPIDLLDALADRNVKDLVIVKTYMGLRFQEAILKKGAALTNEPYRLAEPDEEAKGIDGYIGTTPISIKPATYKLKPALQDGIEVTIIYYEKTKNGLEIDYGEVID